MEIAMQAAHFGSWEPPSAQDMRLVWRQHSMRSQQREITSLFRKSSYVRMLMSSLTRKLDKQTELERTEMLSASQPPRRMSRTVGSQETGVVTYSRPSHVDGVQDRLIERKGGAR